SGGPLSLAWFCADALPTNVASRLANTNRANRRRCISIAQFLVSVRAEILTPMRPILAFAIAGQTKKRLGVRSPRLFEPCTLLARRSTHSKPGKGDSGNASNR